MVPEDFQKYIRSNDFKELLARYQQFLANDDATYFDPDDLLDIAEYYHLKNNPDESMRAAQCCATLFPDNEKAQVFIARTYLMAGETEKAEAVAEAIPSERLLDTIYLKAELMIVHHRVEDAERYLRGHYEVLTNSEMQYDSYFDDDEEDAEDMVINYPLDVAILYIDYLQCDYAEAWLAMVDDKELLGSPDYLECKARLLTAQEKYKEAINVWNAYIDIQAYSVIAWVQLSQCYYREGNCAEALQCAQYAEAIDANLPDAYLAEGNCLFSLGRSEEAVGKFRKFLELCPDDIQGELLLASTLYSINDMEEAKKHILVALERIADADTAMECPDFLSIEVYRQAAFIFSALGDTEEALCQLDNLVFYNVPSDKLKILRVNILLEANRVKEAFDVLTELIRESNHSSEVYVSVGCMLVDANLYEAGYKMLKEVLAILDESGDEKGAGYDRFAYAALVLGHYEDFLEALAVSCEKLPAETVTLFSSFFPDDMPVSEYLEHARNNKITIN